ncbi:MAG: bifunctional tetrahydrofolate synthase/dihydrofolate synthase [Gammaproteobacteria bacterium]|nr:bifunctional tetrahydrofolate synthase/dihydrofolate synthase [Gammaproteobacteria bacterium]
MNATAPSDWDLQHWLVYQERLHPRPIELGLERVAAVGRRLAVLPARTRTLTVAGTNGKGSSAMLAAEIYRAAGYRVGCYTSPHLLRYNERIVIDDSPVADAELCAAFAAVEHAREAVSLTYFEFGTLAALWLFARHSVEVQVLEVGLGGRLDAVNIVDADGALLTNVGLDHRDWLGPDRDTIGTEKAGIFRAGRPAVVADTTPPDSVLIEAERLGASLQLAGRDFGYTKQHRGWRWQSHEISFDALPPPGLPGEFQFANAAGVLAVIVALQPLLPVDEAAIRVALPRLRLPGRLQRVGRRLYDVAHNAEAARALAAYLASTCRGQRAPVVLGMLSDKPVEAVASALAPQAACFYCVGLPPPRGLSAAALALRCAGADVPLQEFEHLDQALAAAERAAGRAGPVVICGSFLTVAAALAVA